MAQEQDERGFTVSDKRFSSRQESERDRPRQSSQPPHLSPEEQESPSLSSEEEVNFASFLISLGTQAFMHFGEIPNPMTQKQEKDIDAAKHFIDLLRLLQVKTKGNLTSEEEQLLQQLLFDLHMRYVQEIRR